MAGNDPQIIYLEKFIEGTTTLPPELQRILFTIKDLDERTEDLGVQLQENVELLLQKAPTPGRKGMPASDEIANLRARCEADQRLLVQFAEEKVQLAVAGYDLLDVALSSLDADIGALQEELRETLGVAPDSLDDGFGMGFDEPAPSTLAPPGGGGSQRRAAAAASGRLREMPSFDSLDTPHDVKPSRRGTTVTLSLPRQGSAYDTDALTPGVDMLGSQRRLASGNQKRPSATPGTGPALAANDDPTYQPRRRAAQAAVHAAAAAVAAMEDEDLGEEAVDPGMPAAGMGSGYGAAAAAGHVGGPVSPDAAAPFPLPPGYSHLALQAPRPQAEGRMLTAADIGPNLVGRHGELFWPDNNSWYLVQIKSVDMVTRTAKVLYATGELEELELDEMAQEQHMSLILPPGGRG